MSFTAAAVAAQHGIHVCGLAVASTNKSLAQSNKSQDVGKATNKHSVLRDDDAERKGPNSTSIRSANLPRLACPHPPPAGAPPFRHDLSAAVGSDE